MIEIENPELRQLKLVKMPPGKFVVEPLERGYGTH